ncbi:putative peptide chain release factor A [Candidatus Carsonella ruddii HT isolate Thao2000]|uniref:Putative peptide chain release factor A n=1 Tax=Candidatus Carsonella ruddii HT isolate Thao2000 TaxID=1202539 RepID=J3TEE8_CARRU|nr:peptide chain release factor-like protein [Candidatus Carsonella ruddii]AFP84087.1 putative peptide chain release factor A [Candidatus Carsonella ruddii HT isolate Thao2000]
MNICNKYVIEIRQGIGGDESIFFLQDLKKMYLKFFQKKNINYKILLNLEKEIIIEIEQNIFDKFIFNESGIHRVQRVPKNENQGKIHTSTCSIFVTKILNNKDIVINNKDLKIETCKSSGSGGQHVNTTNSSVKITHLPTKIFVECSDERSQFLNKTKAIKILFYRINKNINEKNSLQLNLNRKNIISKSERSKKIRTYNFPNNKIINHLNNKNYFQLDKIINGELDILFKN